MSKANNFLKEEDAVSPVIGVILMVAITVILAAVIAAFVFGMGPPEQAPQSAIRASAATIGTNVTVKLEHQGGDAVVLSSTNTKIAVSGNTTTADSDVAFDTDADGQQFEAGETFYLYYTGTAGTVNLGTSNVINASGIIGSSGQTINVKIIDVTSQQMISDLDVRF